MRILSKLKPYIFLDPDLSVFIQILDTLTELIQGPCIENQDNLSRTHILDDLIGIMFS